MEAMKCIVCKQAETQPGTTTVTLERQGATGQLWHVTHRCHEKSFLFKFPRDRRRQGIFSKRAVDEWSRRWPPMRCGETSPGLKRLPWAALILLGG
jgi:hypothetical protein